MSEDYFDLVRGAVAAKVNRMCADAGQLTLGELAARLEAANPDAAIQFEDGTSPGTFDSYRGYYDMIAVNHGPPCTAGEFLKRTNDAIGETFTGYKGGKFTMTRMTPVWVAEYSKCPGIGIVGVDTSEDTVILKTKQIED